MGWTKRQFVEKAYSKIGLGVDSFDIPPAKLNDAMTDMDAMIATWNAKGLRIGYPLASSPTSGDLDQQTGVPDSCNEAIFLNLALRVGVSIGKQLSTDLKDAAKNALDALYAIANRPPQQNYPSTLPRGAGNKPWRYNAPFMPQIVICNDCECDSRFI
jgi:P22 tail accessory factor